MNEQTQFSEDELTCRPLDSYKEILAFVQDPPSWRSLCKELKPHSSNYIRNCDVKKTFSHISLEIPQSFCHFDSDRHDVKRYHGHKLPKTLVCHDMANGYHDDSIIDGTGNHEAYTFYNWAGIDIFCYFSHHLITIPPLAWINVGHAHGVKVIGTIITEWAEGVNFWTKVLESDTEIQNLVSALVAIAKSLKFDGWLLNIENKISNPSKLLEFVRSLHATLHQELQAPLLLWYDSVTLDGQLCWQNKLNDKNKDFFDACDGFFTNYSWSASDVLESVQAAGDRLADLYIGIDVWGRNFFGGGQFNTQEAVKIAHSLGCSLAIFAPAWTHEAIGEENETSTHNMIAMGDHLSKYEKFLLRDRALWNSLWPYINTKLPCTLPFKTSFCRGHGKKRRLYGEVLCPVPWYNLRHMQYQPNAAHGPHKYLLSTQENIINVSHIDLQKNTKGIMKLRESLYDLTKSKANKDQLLSAISEEVSSDTDEEQQDREQDKPNKTQRVVNAFKRFFRKTSKVPEENGPNQNQNPEATSTTFEYLPSTGKSMITMDFMLKLGHAADSKVRYALAFVPEELECLELCLEDSFIGGSCLKINPSDQISTDHRMIRLFHTDLYCEDTIIVCVVTKTVIGFESQHLNVHIFVKDAKGNEQKLVLIGRKIPHKRGAEQSTSMIVNEYPYDAEEPEFRELQKYILLNNPEFYVPVENSYGWKVRYYQAWLPKAQILSINLRTGLPIGPILLGYIGLCHKSKKSRASKSS